MDTEIKVAIIEKIPTYLGLVVFVLLLATYHEEMESYIDRITGLEFAGFAVNFSDTNPPEEYKNEISNYEPGQALKRRLAYLKPQIQKASMLVVHDSRSSAEWLAETFRSLGMSVEIAICSSETEQKMKRHYDVVLSDIKWSQCAEGEKSSVELFNRLKPPGSRVVFYIANLEGPVKKVPHYARELTDSFDDMLNGVLDVIARSNQLAF